MTEAAWLGIDLGTQSVRVIVLDSHGQVLASASRPFASIRSGSRHEQDPHLWWRATRDCLLEATAHVPASHRIRALAISGTSGTVIPIDSKSGMPVGNAVMYDDQRGAPHLARVCDVGADVWGRLGYRMQASWALPKIMTMTEEGELGQGQTFAHQPDIVVAHLSGRAKSDLSSALKTGADLDAVGWPVDVLEGLGLSSAWFPELASSGDIIESVSREAASETGLPVGCMIVAGMTDGCAAQIAAGALSPGSWNSVLGTTLVVKGAAAQRIADPSGVIYAHRGPFDSGWYPGGASSTGAGTISQLLPGADLNLLSKSVSSDIAPIAYPLSGRGERFPFTYSSAAAFYPPDVEHDQGLLFSSIAHGIAFIERLSYDLIDMVGYDISGPLTLTGGGARNAVWNQLRVDILRRPAQVPTLAEGAAGMAILAAAAVSKPSSHDPLQRAARQMIQQTSPLEPDSSRSAKLADAYNAFLDQLELRRYAPLALLTHARERASTR